jgi:hypothetical protein
VTPSSGAYAGVTNPAASALRAESDLVKLVLSGYSQAVLSLPLGSSGERPLIVALHSERQSAQVACEVSKELDGGGSFVLCPSEVRQEDAAAEVKAGIESLVSSYSGRVQGNNISLIAWGKSAKLAIAVAVAKPAQYPRVLLIDPASGSVDDSFWSDFRVNGGKRVFVVSTSTVDSAMKQKLEIADKDGLDVRYLSVGKARGGAVIDELLPNWSWFKQGATREAPIHEHSCPADLHP